MALDDEQVARACNARARIRKSKRELFAYLSEKNIKNKYLYPLCQKHLQVKSSPSTAKILPLDV